MPINNVGKVRYYFLKVICLQSCHAMVTGNNLGSYKLKNLSKPIQLQPMISFSQMTHS